MLNNVNESTSEISLTERNRIEKATNPRILLLTIMKGNFDVDIPLINGRYHPNSLEHCDINPEMIKPYNYDYDYDNRSLSMVNWLLGFRIYDYDRIEGQVSSSMIVDIDIVFKGWNIMYQRYHAKKSVKKLIVRQNLSLPIIDKTLIGRPMPPPAPLVLPPVAPLIPFFNYSIPQMVPAGYYMGPESIFIPHAGPPMVPNMTPIVPGMTPIVPGMTPSN